MEPNDPAVERARQRVKEKRDLAYHAMTYVLIVALLIVLDVRAGTGDQAVLGMDWAYWLALFWGFGLAGHAIHVHWGEGAVEERARRERARDVYLH